MILGQEEVRQTRQAGQYSKHSSLLTDLSLTPSPPQPQLSTPPSTSQQEEEPGPEPRDRVTPDSPAADYNKSEDTQQSIAQEEQSTCLKLTQVQQQAEEEAEKAEEVEEVEETDSSSAKASTINNNSRSVQDVILTCVSPSYCSPSPVYSIPSPGSAFSIVISRRRDSES